MKTRKKPKNIPWKAMLLAAVIAALLVAAHLFHFVDRLGGLESWIKSLGPWGPVVFILLYALWVGAALPVTPPAFLSGFLFGTVVGVVVSNLAVTLGACLAFLIARYFAREAVETWLKGYPTFRKWDEKTAKEGVWAVILCRLLPLLPFNLTNYAFGLTRIGFWPYAFWSWLCMIPAIILYVAGADVVHQIFSQRQVPWILVGIIGGLVFFLALIGSRLKKKFKF